ncbi:LysM peptidoglycan-binding domain-containing protein [Streptomyces sp. NBC_00638]|uniref:LysM peptidoglycan-binding domain-containing protein n=1 Tax=Streptomyces sp. NBC_00638 TaxID=2975794 RepID=UPI00225727F0|nr:LysM peptidoglycan-binding domain-containing protein [Streptomyces sp. NBC_00638]MCX5009196.1 LysM peptidoglycan-binding domain-containing protein [Streptomyces sp. NBC_00638]
MRNRTLGRLFKAVVSLLVLVVAVGGLPLLLTWATPVIWASSHDELAHLLDRQDTGAVFLLVLVVVGWMGWAQFTFCALRELLAQLRGRRWHAPRGLGTSQRAAALLVGSILVLLPTGSALASDAQAATTATASRTPGQAPQAEPSSRVVQASAAAPESSSSYTVREMRPAESLWSIAERELGDGERWREIADLNEGHAMGGGHVFRSNSFLQPGWKLAMPESLGPQGLRAQSDGRASVAAEKGERVVTVHSGDSLSKIAENEVGDGGAWPALFEASKGQRQPDGLPAITDPDMIYAGQHVTVPGARPDQDSPPVDRPGSNGSEPPSASHTPPDQKPSEGPGGQDDMPAATPSQSAALPSSAPRTPSAPSTPSASAAPHESAEPAAPTSQPAPSSPEGAEPAPASSLLNLRTVVGAGALLAAAVTAALALRRTLQRRRRKPGETIAITAQTAPAEAQLAAAAEPSGVARLDVVLRTMVHAAERDGRGVPVLRAARLDARTVHVLPDDLASAPQVPFVAGAAGWWRLDAGVELLDEETARTIAAPCPALVTVGSAESGDLVLADLARLPVVLLDGNPVHISEVCTSLALELGMSPWARDVEVVAVGFGEDLPHLLPNSRIAHMRQPAHALRDLTERLLEVHQMPETADHPYVVLCASALDDDTAWQFADILGKAPQIPVTLIAPTGTTSGHFPEADILAVSAQTPQRFDPLGIDITVQRLEHAAYQQIITALAVSGQPANEAEGAWQHVPGEPSATGRRAEPNSQEDLPGDNGTMSPAVQNGSGAAGSDADDAVFPALLKASADPGALSLAHVLPAATGGIEPLLTVEETSTSEANSNTVERTQAQAPADEDAGEASVSRDSGPEIRVLGPVDVDGLGRTGHGPRTAQLAALLYFRPGRTADVLCADMDPISPWSTATLNARLQGLRRALGNDADGEAYVPRRRNGDDPYTLADGVRCDWTRFVQLAERALSQGPQGLADLEEALSLVRGRPFGTRAPAWAEPHQQEMTTRIIDVAHTIATHRTHKGVHYDLGAARKAIVTGLDVDETAELLYRDWLIVEWMAGNRPGLHTAITRIQHVTQALDCDLELETEQLIQELLTTSRKAPTP